MDGLEITIFNSCDIFKDNEEFRLDSEYYKKEYINLYTKIVNSPKLIDLVKMSDLSTNGSFATVKKIMSNEKPKSIPFIRSGNCGETFINLNDLEYISELSHKQLPKSTTKLHDIMMARKGKIGGASIITENEVNYNCNENVIKLTIKDKARYNPFYFTVYFNSKFGLKQIERLSTGNVQPWLSIFQIRKLLIPELDKSFQLQIENFVKSSYHKLEESKTLYKEAEELLLGELDLLDFRPSEENIAIKSFKESFGVSGRLDSEYYQPKYDEIIAKIKSYKGGFEELKKITLSYSGGYAFSSDDYLENGVLALIRINNIKNGYLDLSNAVFLPNEHKNLSKKDIVKEGDIIISMSGSIGLSCKIDKNINAMVNQRILKIEVDNFKKDVLVLVLNSIISSMQLARIGTGGVQTNISSSDILNIIIPLIDISIQTQIEEKINQSFELKEESKQLLDLAKRVVEVAIEKDEEVAMELIKGI